MSVKIFLVESNDRIRELIKEHISIQKSMEILSEVEDGEEALKIFEKNQFDVVLLDLSISEQNSLEVLNSLIEIDPTPIIVLSAINPEEMDSSMQALLLGAFDYIVKPMKLTQRAIIDFKNTVTKKINLASQSQLRRIIKQEDISNRTTSIRQSVIDEIFEFGRQINKGDMEDEDKIEIPQSFYRQKEIDKLFNDATRKRIKDNPKVKIDKIKKETIKPPPSLRQRDINEIFTKAKITVKTSEKNESEVSKTDIKKSRQILNKRSLSDRIIKEKKDSDLKIDKYITHIKESNLQDTIQKIEKITPREKEFKEAKRSAKVKLKDSKNQKKKVKARKEPISIRDLRDYDGLKPQKKRSKSHKLKTRKISKPVSLDKMEFGFQEESLKSKESIVIESNIVVIGASVGGPRTITQILKTIPSNFSCPILIVQHLTNQFVDIFVSSLNENCALNVKIAEDGELIERSTVYIAPGNYHMSISTEDSRPIIKVFQGPPIHFCIPSIDVLFSSAAQVYKKSILAILLTGMGKDGVKGMGIIKEYGGRTIAEAKETSILYGMPKSAVKKGYAELILPNYEIADYLNKYDRYTTLSSRY